MLSVEALHQLHIFIFILAIAHVIFCVLTMLLGTARVSIIEILLILRVYINLLVSNDFNSLVTQIRQWKHWEDEFQKDSTENGR